MLDKYRIGLVAKLLDLPNETLRYYESRGIVTPHKDEESGYRYYDAWDLNNLLDSIYYRSFDFSLSDVEKMINEDTKKDIVDRCLIREAELLQTIYDYKQKLYSLMKFRQRITQAEVKVGVFEITESPSIIFQRQRVKNQFIFDDDALKVTNKWLNLMPNTNHTFVFPNYNIYDDNSFNEYWWGFSVSPDDAVHYGIDITQSVVLFPPTKSIYTVFIAGGRNTFAPSMKSKVTAKILEAGHKIIGPPVGHLIVRPHEDGVFTRFFEVWVPIE